MWAQQLYRKIDHPMRFFKKKTALLKVGNEQRMVYAKFKSKLLTDRNYFYFPKFTFLTILFKLI